MSLINENPNIGAHEQVLLHLVQKLYQNVDRLTSLAIYFTVWFPTSLLRSFEIMSASCDS